jgi:hypothetical protein
MCIVRAFANNLIGVLVDTIRKVFFLGGGLKGQSHKKVGEMSVWGISLGHN